MISKLSSTLGALALAAGAVLATGTPAGATTSVPAGYGNQAAMNLSLTGARFTMRQSSTGCHWVVTSDVTVVNLTSGTETASAVGASVTFQGPGTDGTKRVEISEQGSPPLAAGQTFAAFPTEEVYKGVQFSFTIPCAAQNGTLSLDVTDEYGTGSADVPFLVNGTPLPLGVVGGSVGALALGAVFAGTKVRRHRRT